MRVQPYIAAFALLLLGSCVSQPTQPSQQQADAGRLDIYEEFATELIPERTVYVWVPDDYNTDTRYAVLYMHDGQMLFDERTSWNGQSWNVDAVAQRMQDEGRCRPFIVVGIDNHPKDRLTEYMPAKALNYLDPNNKLLNKIDRNKLIADSYLRFIVEDLKPFVDSYYSTLSDSANTAIMGSSMGGLISLYALTEHPDIFGSAACLSTHTPLAVDDIPTEAPSWSKAFRDYLDDNLPEANSHTVYMDYGDGSIDGHYAPFQQEVDRLFEAKGWTEPHYITLKFPGHDHNETSWQQRLHIPLELLLGSE